MAQAVQIAWHELESSPEWRALTPSQKTWSLVFLVTGNALGATKTAYHAKSGQNASILTYELKKNPSIVAALEIAAGHAPILKPRRDPERTKIIAANRRLTAQTRRQLASAEPGSVAGQRLLSQLTTLLEQQERLALDPEPEPAKPVHRFHVGDIATLEGKQYRVTAVREDGTVSEADPL